MVFTAYAKSKDTGETAFVVTRYYTPDPGRVPGPYRNSLLASVKRELQVLAANTDPGVAKDAWEVEGPSGAAIALKLEYQRSVPTRGKRELKIYSSVDPSFYRIYRTDEAVDVVKSVPGNVDRVKHYSFTIKLPEYAKVLDGTEQLIAIVQYPLYVINISLP